MSAGPVAARGCGEAGWKFPGDAGVRSAAAGSLHTAALLSQRDYFNQPSVDATTERLRWVANHKLKSTLKGLRPCARDGDATTLGLKMFLDG